MSEKVPPVLKLYGESPTSEIKAGGSSVVDWWDQWSTAMHFAWYRLHSTLITQGDFFA